MVSNIYNGAVMANTKNKVVITKFKILGFPDLEESLASLTDKNFRTNALRAAGRKSMTPLKEDLMAAAPILKETSILPTGSVKNALKDSIRLRISANKNPKITKSGKSITKASKNEFRAVIATGQEAAGYAVVSEYGRQETPINRYSAFGKVVAAYEVNLPTLVPKPWMRTTFDANKARVLTTFGKELKRGVTKQAKKQARLRAK